MLVRLLTIAFSSERPDMSSCLITEALSRSGLAVSHPHAASLHKGIIMLELQIFRKSRQQKIVQVPIHLRA